MDFYFIQPFWLLAVFFALIWFSLTKTKLLKLPTVIQPITLNYPLLKELNNPNKPYVSPHNSRLMIAVILSLIFVSLAQPVLQKPITNIQPTKQAVDLILVVNTSVSMVLKDYMENGTQFDRMAKTKQLLSRLVEQFQGDRMALVILGRPAAVWLPLTHDKQQIRHAISRLQTTLGGRSNDVGSTLQLVLQQFNKPSNNRKTVLLVNDAYLQSGSISPIDSINQLTKNKFTVHSLAIGSPKRPEYSLGIGHLIYAPVDLELMESFAKAGNGIMVHAWNNDAVAELLMLLDQPNNVNNSASPRFYAQNLSHYPLALAMLMLIFMLLPLRLLK